MIVPLSVIILIAIFWGLYKYEREKEARRREVVGSTSELIKSLVRLNGQYHFYSDVKWKYVRLKEFESKVKYDKYDCSELFDSVVFHEYDKFRIISQKIQENRNGYDQYAIQIRQLYSSVTQEIVQKYRIPFEVYRRLEDQLFAKYQLTPVTKSEIVCIARYASPKGRKLYSKERNYSIFEVADRYQELKKIVIQRDFIQEQRKRERAKMSDSLRYDILRRDGFKCQICGRTQEDGIKLHVDHIVPIARGGKTEESNLRTLCDQCNLGKRDKIE